ncbi:hypothetical protein [Desulfosediminicola ganghwensis]|uniref:hypothetical protein n=1 Tax=Desulfosediminicola ganghwensis TaxID=2569540 RepID=UPI0010AC71C9|nr:hypothetical protein [Desulfosediminicola ganghwensis]
MKFRCAIVAGIVNIALMGCGGVSDRGSENVLSKGSKYAVRDNSFAYRQLKIEDFKAEALDRGPGNVVHHVQARSCISIQTAADTRIRSKATEKQGKEYVGTLSNVRYQAIFEPYCSWWNTGVAENRVEYILEHEQIHFALTELSARKLNERVQQSFNAKTIYGSTVQEVEDKLRDKVRLASKKAIAMSSNDHSDFDNQTSFVYEPEKQQSWLENVTRRLAETEQYR